MRSEEVRILVRLALSLAICPTAAAAQTRFDWPDTAVDLARYTSVEDCLAATARIHDGLARLEELAVWRDTLPRDQRATLEPAPAAVTAVAVRCAARFAPPAVDLHDFGSFLSLFLAAGRDSDAATLVARRLAAVGPNSPRERTRVVDSAVRIYLDARPARLAAAESVLLGRARAESRIERLQTYDQLRQASDGAGDTARARRAARWMLGVADSLTAAERQSEQFESLAYGQGGQWLIYAASGDLMGPEPFLDSLRRSTAALGALQRAMFARASGQSPETVQWLTGFHAPAVTADYWFPADAGSGPRPRPGHVSLVVFVDVHACIGEDIDDIAHDVETSEVCIARLALLRRLGHRFPALEITLVTSTRGAFLYLPPLTPADEAELMWRFLEGYQLPNTALSVSTTPSWRLPDPDERRIDKDIPNLVHYNPIPTFNITWGSILLVDADGVIVQGLRSSEDELRQFIDVLLHRPSTER